MLEIGKRYWTWKMPVGSHIESYKGKFEVIKKGWLSLLAKDLETGELYYIGYLIKCTLLSFGFPYKPIQKEGSKYD